MRVSKLTHVAHGVIATLARQTLGVRLAALHAALAEVIAMHRPDAIAVEQAFVAKDPSAALKLGHARAVALLAAAEAGLEIAEYAPNHIKKSVVGVGHASKEQVQAMVRRLLPTARSKQPMRPTRWPAPSRMRILRARNARIAAAGWRYDRQTHRPRRFRRRRSRHPRCRRRRLSGALPVIDAVASWRRARCQPRNRNQSVSEDAIRLYGFSSAEEREWFRLLQTVQNVGARVALSLLARAVARANSNARLRWATRR